jgi:hypothetical protein
VSASLAFIAVVRSDRSRAFNSDNVRTSFRTPDRRVSRPRTDAPEPKEG